MLEADEVRIAGGRVLKRVKAAKQCNKAPLPTRDLWRIS
jgi:hypothetical protein